MSVESEYMAAFNSCYPHKAVTLKGAMVFGTWKYRVYINGEAGDMRFTESELRDAIRAFNAGRRLH